MRGAGAAAYGIKPDAAIVYDVTLTGDGIGAKPMACVVGGGAAIKLKDSSLICDRPFADELAQVAAPFCPAAVCTSVRDALTRARAEAGPGELVVVCGSVYLVGDVLGILESE